MITLFGEEPNIECDAPWACYDDTWEWDGRQWSERHGDATPAPRSRASLVFDPLLGGMRLLGGSDLSYAAFDDEWELGADGWHEVTEPVRPPTRWKHAAAFDDARNVLVLFGGVGSREYSDFWEHRVLEVENGADDDCDGTMDESRCTLKCSATVPLDAFGMESVVFQATGEVVGTNCSGAASFEWTFGDAGTATGANVTHAYDQAGLLPWTVTVRSQDDVCMSNGTISVTKLLTITRPSASGRYETGSLTLSLAGMATQALAKGPTWQNARTGKSGKTKLDGTKTAWSASKVGLVGGENTIIVSGTVGATEARDRIIVIADDHSGPVVTIKSPKANSSSKTNMIKISGKAKDPIGVASVEYRNLRNGVAGRCKGTTSWSATGVRLEPGANEITVTATDGAGNARTVSVVVTN